MYYNTHIEKKKNRCIACFCLFFYLKGDSYEKGRAKYYDDARQFKQDA